MEKMELAGPITLYLIKMFVNFCKYLKAKDTDAGS